MIELKVPAGLVASDHIRSSMLGTLIGHPGMIENVPGDEAVVFTGGKGDEQYAYLCKTDEDLGQIKEDDFEKPKWFSVGKVHVMEHFETEELGAAGPTTEEKEEAPGTSAEEPPGEAEAEPESKEDETPAEEGSGDIPPDPDDPMPEEQDGGNSDGPEDDDTVDDTGGRV